VRKKGGRGVGSAGRETGRGGKAFWQQRGFGMQQQQHLMQMNQGMMGGGYASPAAVTTDLIQQVVIYPSQTSPRPFYPPVLNLSFPFTGAPLILLSRLWLIRGLPCLVDCSIISQLSYSIQSCPFRLYVSVPPPSVFHVLVEVFFGRLDIGGRVRCRLSTFSVFPPDLCFHAFLSWVSLL
jgi:hypothetical protein